MGKKILAAIAGLFAIPAVTAFLGGLTFDAFIIAMATISGIGSLTLLLTQAIKNAWEYDGWLVRLISWVVATGLISISKVTGLGFIEYDWWSVIVMGVFTGLATNGAYTIEQIKIWLNILVEFFKKKPKVIK